MTFSCIKCKIHNYTNTQTYAISMGFKDIKYDIPVYQMLNTQIRKYIYTLHLHMATSFFYIFM